MDSSSLADQLIDKRGAASPSRRPFSLEDAPDIIFERHPSIYLHGGRLYHEHNLIRPGDIKYLFQLIDDPYAKISTQQGIWIYNRLLERAAVLDERYIVISCDMVWDRATAKIMPIGDAITTKDNTTRRLNGRNAK